ncbi:MAG TPA: DUF547 domain-containing protein [Acidobacteriota bacterium]|nr:DUF547 domain-containing protein [Acidobacteriota bacterium]
MLGHGAGKARRGTARRTLGTVALAAWAALHLAPSLPTGCSQPSAQPAGSAAAFDHAHPVWQQVLQEHVSPQGRSTVFDYRALSSRRSRFDAYLEQLSSVTRHKFQSWSEARQLAFLINAYNAFTVEWIVRHWPVGSIRDTADNPWAVEFIHLLGDRCSLDQIEHQMIRPVYEEPLVHFAVNCASVGCPALRKEAYTAERLDGQLEDAARSFLRDRQQNRIEGDVLYLSSLFKWYSEDFEKRYGGVLPFVAERITDEAEAARRIRQGQLEVRYVDYDWSLNAPAQASSSSPERRP